MSLTKEKNIIDNNTNQINNDDNKKTKSTFKKVWNIISWVLVSLVCALLVVIFILLMIGYKPAVVLTPSMTPSIMPGDLIVYKAVDADKIEIGDVITFWPSADSQDEQDLSVTHRVKEIRDDGDGTYTFITHGDANGEEAIETVPEERIIGKVCIVIPWVGQLFLFIKNNLFVVIFGIISIILVYYLVSMIVKSNKNKNTNNTNDNIDNNLAQNQ